MDREPLRWTSILQCCQEAFRKEPVLEMGLGGAYREVYGKYQGEEAARRFRYRGTLKSGVYPYYFMARAALMRHSVAKATLLQGDRPPGRAGVFVITESRDNNFGCIFPLLKRFDELGRSSVLFVSAEAWEAKEAAIRSLRHCRVVLIDLLKYISPAASGFKVRRDKNMYMKGYAECCTDDRVRAFIEEFGPFLSYDLMDLLHTERAIEEVLRPLECGFIISMGVPPGEFRWALAGKRLGIRTYVVSHGFVETAKIPVHYSPSNSDEIVLWGEVTEPLVREVCGPDHAISVLGNPAYDTIVTDYLTAQRDPGPLLAMGFRPEAKTLVFFSGTHVLWGKPEKHIEPIKALREVKRAFGDRVNVIVKLHPHETPDLYRQHLGDDLGRFIIVKGEVELFKLMRLADLAASLDSTTLLEAMIFKVPTLQLGLTSHGVEADYHKRGAALLVRTKEELVGIVDAMLKGDDDLVRQLRPGQERYVGQYLTNLGTATERILEHLLAG